MVFVKNAHSEAGCSHRTSLCTPTAAHSEAARTGLASALALLPKVTGPVRGAAVRGAAAVTRAVVREASVRGPVGGAVTREAVRGAGAVSRATVRGAE